MEHPAEPIRLALEIERGIEPLSGRVRPYAGEPRTFVGWTGLAAALTAALEDVARRDVDVEARRGPTLPPES